MKINPVNVINSRPLVFGRRLTAEEEKDYRNNAIKPALKYLGNEEVAMILHGTCYPEKALDIGVGSPYGSAAKNLMKFEMLHGFNSNQLGPVGVIRDASYISPYKSTIFTRNYLFIDFSKLTNNKYANILSVEDLEPVFNKPKNNGKNYAYSNFPDAYANYEYCMDIAYKNFKKKYKEKNAAAILLNEEFKDFKKEKGSIVYKEALFSILAKTYATPDFKKWDEIDKNLIQLLKNHDSRAIERNEKISQRSKEQIGKYIFAQFLVDKQAKENAEIRKYNKFKYISDFLVGFARSDEWANQDLFLKDYRMGCPHGGQYGPQLWDIPVLNPDKLFNTDGSLGPAGVYLKKKLEAALDTFDNVRIDHVLGLIDPYVYKPDSVEIIKGKIDMNKFRGNNISNIKHLDPRGNYKKILNKIILPTLKEHGIDKNSPVWEDLCTATPAFNKIYHTKNNLPGITQLEWMRGEYYQHTNNWGLVGSHDSDPATQMIKKDWVKNGDAWNIFYLAGFLNSNPARAKYRDEYCKKIDSNDMERVKAKFAELFLTSRKVQISFADFFGIDKTYNKGGEENSSSWKLRLNNDYEDTYYKNLASENPTAINMPEILKIAVQAKADMNTLKLAKNLMVQGDDISATNDVEVQKILDKLDKYERILKE